MAPDPILWVEKTQCRCRDDRLLYRNMSIFFCYFQICISIGLVMEWSCIQPRQLAHVTVSKVNHDTIRSDVLKSMDWICCKARLGLFPVRDDRRPCRFEELYGVSDC